MSRVAQFFRPAQTLPVLPGRRAKQPPILSAELRGTVIPHGKTDSGDVLRRQQEPGAGLLQAKYMAKQRAPPSQGWRTFLHNHAPDIAAMDLFVVPDLQSSDRRP
jgi:hypothetical protein